MFHEGERKVEYSAKNLLPLSGKLIPEFDKRRSIRDMFFKKPIIHESKQTPEKIDAEDTTSISTAFPSVESADARQIESGNIQQIIVQEDQSTSKPESNSASPISPIPASSKRRAQDGSVNRVLKRSKSSTISTNGASARGQQSLRGFLTSTLPTPKAADVSDPSTIRSSGKLGSTFVSAASSQPSSRSISQQIDSIPEGDSFAASPQPGSRSLSLQTDSISGVDSFAASQPDSRSRPKVSQQTDSIPEADSFAESTSTTNKSPLQSPIESETGLTHDPIVAKESWSKLFSKHIPPRCEGHEEPCITLLTKKPGINCGRSFYICPRPLGPSGSKEKGTQWRCTTFIWCSDWNSNVA